MTVALTAGQVSVRDLVMGPGTPFGIVDGFNPFERDVRADQSGQRAWNHGSWSGVEWMEEAVIPIYIRVADDANRTPARWLELHQQLMAAFRPVGEEVQDVELRFHIGGRELLMLGRPRVVTPDITLVRTGRSLTQAVFVALDPTIYAGAETSFGPIGLPTFTGGLTIPGVMSVTVLNSNPGFEVDKSTWFTGGGTLTQTTAQAHSGTGSGLFEPNGTSATVEAGTSAGPVTAGEDYSWAAWLYSPSAVSGVRMRIVWRDSLAADISSDYGDTVTIPAGEWTRLVLTRPAVAGAVDATPRVQITGTPAATTDLYIDDAEFTSSGEATGGLTVPFSISGTAASGFTTVVNDGTKDTGMFLRLDGPVSEPSVTLERADGSFQRLRFDLELSANQWLDVDTKNRLVLLNGTTTQRGNVSGNWPIVPPGTHTLRWSSATYNEIAQLSGSVRSAWH